METRETEPHWTLAVNGYDIVMRASDVQRATDDIQRGVGWMVFHDPEGVTMHLRASSVDGFSVTQSVDEDEAGVAPTKYLGIGGGNASGA